MDTTLRKFYIVIPKYSIIFSAKRKYIEHFLESVRERVCSYVCVHLFRNNPSRNVKIKYIGVYENSSDTFNIWHCWIKVKV